MGDLGLSLDERQRNRVRAGIADVENRLSSVLAERLGEDDLAARRALAVAWRELVVLLAIPEEPERRGCPHCTRPIRIQATRCVHCLKKSAATASKATSREAGGE
jgi:hypothetical protein